MRWAIVGTLLVAVGCGTAPVAVDGGAPDGGPLPDAGAAWERLGCTAVTERPRFGEVPFCPAVHDYIGARESRDVDAGPIDASELCLDGGASGVSCGGPWTVSTAVWSTCETWVSCPRAAEADPCFHCATWADDPWLGLRL